MLTDQLEASSLQQHNENQKCHLKKILIGPVVYHILDYLTFQDISKSIAPTSKWLKDYCPRIYPPFTGPPLHGVRGNPRGDPSRHYVTVPVSAIPNTVNDRDTLGNGQYASLVRFAIKCRWKDQGWGNRKGRIGLSIMRKTDDNDDEIEIFRYPFGKHTAEHDWTILYDEVPISVLRLLKSGDAVKLWYIVGGGGGHQLFVEDFRVIYATGLLSCRAEAPGQLPAQYGTIG